MYCKKIDYWQHNRTRNNGNNNVVSFSRLPTLLVAVLILLSFIGGELIENDTNLRLCIRVDSKSTGNIRKPSSQI